ATVAIRCRAANPAAQRRRNQRHAADKPRLGLADAPFGDDRRTHEAEHLHVERIERPAAETGPERAPLVLRYFAIPGKHLDSTRRMPTSTVLLVKPQKGVTTRRSSNLYVVRKVLRGASRKTPFERCAVVTEGNPFDHDDRTVCRHSQRGDILFIGGLYRQSFVGARHHACAALFIEWIEQRTELF